MTATVTLGMQQACEEMGRFPDWTVSCLKLIQKLRGRRIQEASHRHKHGKLAYYIITQLEKGKNKLVKMNSQYKPKKA